MLLVCARSNGLDCGFFNCGEVPDADSSDHQTEAVNQQPTQICRRTRTPKCGSSRCEKDKLPGMDTTCTVGTGCC
jgi:hypothetical protein